MRSPEDLEDRHDFLAFKNCSKLFNLKTRDPENLEELEDPIFKILKISMVFKIFKISFFQKLF